MIAWIVTVSALFVLWLVVAWLHGPQRAIGCMVLVACLVPTWAKLELGTGFWLDCRVAATILGLCAYCLHPQANFPIRLGWLDATMLGLLAVHVVSDIENGAWAPGIPLRLYGEWCVPYFAGRLALQRHEDLRFLSPWGIGVALVLALGSIFEGATGQRPWELLYGERDYDGILREHVRWGITRAWGCCAHPIYFGFLHLMFLPWLLRLWHRTRGKRLHWFLWLVPLAGLAGIFCTGSRTALLGGAAVVLLGLVAFIPWSRIPVGLVVVGALVLAIWQPERAARWVTQWGETVNERRKVELNEETLQASGTMSRYILVLVYKDALWRASWLGFGTDAVTGFPVRVPVGAMDPEVLKAAPFIDNQYVLMTLRFGWAGATAFTVALILAAIAWFQRSGLSDPRSRFTSSSAVSLYIGGTIIAVAAGLLTVWMPHDIGFPLLWWMGAGSSTPKRSLGKS